MAEKEISNIIKLQIEAIENHFEEAKKQLDIQKKKSNPFFVLLSLPSTAMGFALSVQISALSWILSTRYGLEIDKIGIVAFSHFGCAEVRFYGLAYRAGGRIALYKQQLAGGFGLGQCFSDIRYPGNSIFVDHGLFGLLLLRL